MDTETVQIPSASNSGRMHAIPPITVGLPLEVHTRASLQLLCAFFNLAGSAASIVVVVLAIWLLVFHQSEWITWIVAVGCMPLCLVVAISGPATAWICLRDALRTGPAMIVRADGIEDLRSAATIPWETVSQARIAYSRGRLNHVHLTLRTPIYARYNPLRFGTIGYPWRRRPDALRVPVVLLDVKPYTLAQVVAALVKRNGGEITASGGPMLPT